MKQTMAFWFKGYATLPRNDSAETSPAARALIAFGSRIVVSACA